MKVTMLAPMCGPDGNAFPGTVLDISDKRTQTFVDADGKSHTMPLAEYMIANKFARHHDQQLDRKAKQGLVKAEK